MVGEKTSPIAQKDDDKFDPGKLDARSYQLGMIYAFAEMVASGCKRMALSPALTKHHLESIIHQARQIAREYDLILDVDSDFLTTKLFNPEYTRGKIVIHIAAEQAVIDEYKALKEYKKRHVENGTLTDEIEVDIAWKLGRLLSYSDEAIEDLLIKPRF